MWQSIIPKVPEDISVDDFFITFVPNQLNQLKNLFKSTDCSFLNGNIFKIQFDIEGQIYSLTFKKGKKPEVAKGSMDKPNVMIVVSEKYWRDAVISKFNELADNFTGDPTVFIDMKHYEALRSMNGKVNIYLKNKDDENIPISLIFNGEENPAVTVNLDMLDALHWMNKSATGLGLLMNGKLKLTGSILLLMKLQNLIQGMTSLDGFDIPG